MIEPTKLMLAGDWHGHVDWAEDAVRHAAEHGADVILHLGDFGFWTPGAATDFFLNRLNRTLRRCRITLYWVDGNHEFHPRIPQGNKPWETRSHIIHLPRAFRWKWWGVAWMALGGAHSVDRPWRTEGRSWWPEEWISDGELLDAMRPGKVDVMVTHDCPAGVPIPGIGPPSNGTQFPYEELVRSEEHRQRLRLVVEAKQPAMLFHGHYHVRHRAMVNFAGKNTIVTGLDREGSPGNVLFMTKEDYYREESLVEL